MSRSNWKDFFCISFFRGTIGACTRCSFVLLKRINVYFYFYFPLNALEQPENCQGIFFLEKVAKVMC